MAEKNSDRELIRKRFVAFLDIMGFKEWVARSSLEDIYNTLINFSFMVGTIDEVTGKNLSGRGIKAKIKSIIFSDSILLVSEDDSNDSAYGIVACAGWVLMNATVMGIPLKGVIAHGEQTADFDNSLHFGKPLIDAYELQDELQLYGVILHHTMEKRLVELQYLEKMEREWVLKYPVPMRSGRITHYIVNLKPDPDEKAGIVEGLQGIYEKVSGEPRKYVDNTVEFIQKVL